MESVEQAGAAILEADPERSRPFFWGAADYVTSPVRFFETLGTSPRWFFTYLLCALAATATSFLMFPFIQQATLASLSQQLDGAQTAKAMETFAQGRWFGLGLTPLFLLGKMGLEACVLAVIVGGVSGKTSVKAAFSLVMHLQPIVALQGATAYVWASYIGVENVRGARELQFSLGMDQFLDDGASPMANFLLHLINPYDILWFLYLYIGIRMVMKQSKSQAGFAGAIFFGLTIVFGIGITMLSQDVNSFGL